MSGPRVHGGPDALGVPEHDFSTNGNACGPCPPALVAVQQAEATHYPDAAYTAVRARLAALHGVAGERILIAASASEFIFRVSAWAARQARPTVWLPPQHYGDCAAAARAWGLRRVQRPAEAALRWACDPSSPLGQAQPGWQDWLPGAQRGDALCVLDRAYEPLRLDGALALTQEQLPRVWQLYSPNKALGLTGVRAAYAIAPLDASATLTQLEAFGPSWPVGAHGVALLQAWVRPETQDWVRASLNTLRAWKARQLALCAGLGWRCEPSLANYFCAMPELQGPSLASALGALRAQGIKLRDAASFGLAGRVRLGVLAPEAQDALRAAWLALRERNAA